MAEAPREISEPKLLIGEGWEEVYFFSALFNSLALNHIQVEQYGGKAKLSAYLKNLVKRPGFPGRRVEAGSYPRRR